LGIGQHAHLWVPQFSSGVTELPPEPLDVVFCPPEVAEPPTELAPPVGGPSVALETADAPPLDTVATSPIVVSTPEVLPPTDPCVPTEPLIVIPPEGLADPPPTSPPPQPRTHADKPSPTTERKVIVAIS
jgi:hypothetical protein